MRCGGYALLGTLLLLASCGPQEPTAHELSTRLEALPSDRPYRLEEAVGLKRVAAACVLHPYQTRIDLPSPKVERINSYLDETRYEADEGHWALAVVTADTVTLYRFRRSSSLDLVWPSMAESMGKDSVHRDFAIADCATGAGAAFLKIRDSGRTYLIFGNQQQEGTRRGRDHHSSINLASRGGPGRG
jgi:hypothetical protein